MPTITKGDAYRRAERSIARELVKTAAFTLNKETRAQSTSDEFDIFLSHSSRDAQLILGVKGILVDLGYSVYVDWVEDRQLDRSRVTAETASILRSRMNLCRALFYASTDNSTESKWMPWECGYFDGKNGKTAILPVTEAATSDFRGQEYLGLYPYVVTAPEKRTSAMRLWVHETPKVYVEFEAWLDGSAPGEH